MTQAGVRRFLVVYFVIFFVDLHRFDDVGQARGFRRSRQRDKIDRIVDQAGDRSFPHSACRSGYGGALQ